MSPSRKSVRRGRLRNAAAALWFVGMAGAASGAPDGIVVQLDQAQVAKLPDRVSTVVVGNPLIADVSVQSGGMMVVTGKGYGLTNLVALDRTGAVLLEQSVQVVGPRDGVVVVYRGVDRESYSCAPNCERRITLGDTQPYFESTLAQTGTRNGLAQGSSAPSPR